jgi:hypothetical protein
MRVRKVIVVMAVAAVLAFLLWKAKAWLDIDRCLDAGGRWDYGAGTCDFGPSGPPVQPK